MCESVVKTTFAKGEKALRALVRERPLLARRGPSGCSSVKAISGWAVADSDCTLVTVPEWRG